MKDTLAVADLFNDESESEVEEEPVKPRRGTD